MVDSTGDPLPDRLLERSLLALEPSRPLRVIRRKLDRFV
jgi:hypothetical protein